MANQSKSLSPNSNGLANNLGGSPNQIHHGQANGSLASSPEKPQHYTYLKGFRVEQCALFLQHKCTNHKPFTCFDWHFQNQRRRRPVRRRDGTFNYSPDTYCTKYDETTGLCPDKDDCPYLHKTAGDTERRYHLRYYKTGICVYETDARGYCSKNGKHCAFAHGNQDLRNPVFDVRELQSLENGNSSGELSDASVLLAAAAGSGASIDRERNALLEDPRWNETAYVLANYKTVLCKRPPRFCRQGYACPQYHNGKDRRRSPKVFRYRSTPCPSTKQGDEWVDPSKCEQGDQCPYCHSRTEQQFHPEIFKSTKCKDIQDTGYCPRGAFCAFAHNEEEIIATRDIDLENIDTDSSRVPLSQSYPGESQLLRNQRASDDLRSTLESQLNESIERMRPFNNLDDDDDNLFSNDIRRMSDRNDNIILGAHDSSEADTIVNNLLGIDPVIRPRSTSTSAYSSLFWSSSRGPITDATAWRR